MKKVEPHFFTTQKTFQNKSVYKRFLNWLSGEFDLYLQDNSDCFTVYFPYKKLSVTQLEKADSSFVAQINVEAKISQEGVKLINAVDSLYLHLLRMNS